MSCAVASTHDDGDGNLGRSYWFPYTSTTELGAIAGGTLEVWADETSHLISGFYGGLNRW